MIDVSDVGGLQKSLSDKIASFAWAVIVSALLPIPPQVFEQYAGARRVVTCATRGHSSLGERG